MEAFYGSWKMVSKARLDDYMKALGKFFFYVLFGMLNTINTEQIS